jgi:hypothetical protein
MTVVTRRDAGTAPVVHSFEPSAAFRRMTAIGNKIMVPLLRSRAGAKMHGLALLAFTGRRTGRRYEVPVAYHEIDGQGLVFTASPWRVNMRDGRDVDVTTEGRTRRMHAALVEDRDQVASVYASVLEREGLSEPTNIGLKIDVDRMPTHAELVEGIGDRRSAVRLTPV